MDLRQRIERLEKQNERLRLVAVLAIAILAGTVLLGQLKPSEVKAAQGKVVGKVVAEKFVLVDGAGQERAVLQTSDKGTIFYMLDGDNSTVVKFTTTPKSVAVGVSQRQRPGKDKPYDIHATLGIDEQKPKIELRDKEGTVFARP